MRRFVNGFMSISVVWVLFFVFDLILFYTMVMCFDYAETGLFIHWAVPMVGLILSMILHAVATVFHSQFQCTIGQLIRNAFLMLISHPLCSLAVAALTWTPMVLFFLAPNTFLQISPLFITVYFSIAFMFGVIVMKKPFKQLIDAFDAEEEETETATEA